MCLTPGPPFSPRQPYRLGRVFPLGFVQKSLADKSHRDSPSSFVHRSIPLLSGSRTRPTEFESSQKKRVTVCSFGRWNTFAIADSAGCWTSAIDQSVDSGIPDDATSGNETLPHPGRCRVCHARDSRSRASLHGPSFRNRSRPMGLEGHFPTMGRRVESVEKPRGKHLVRLLFNGFGTQRSSSGCY